MNDWNLVSLMNFLGNDPKEWDAMLHSDFRVNVTQHFFRVLDVLVEEERFEVIGELFLGQITFDRVTAILNLDVNEIQQLNGDQFWKK